MPQILPVCFCTFILYGILIHKIQFKCVYLYFNVLLIES